MKKLLVALAIVSYMAVSITPLQSRITWKRSQVEEATKKTVLIIAEYETGEAIGAGVFLSKEGLILTAAHVVDGEPSGLYAITETAVAYKCVLIGSNKLKDLALLRVYRSAQKFPFARLCENTDLWVGQPLLLVGHPNELYWTVSMGNITRIAFQIVRFCKIGETDAFVNPGNSGGPVFNRNGELIGIVSAMYVDWFKVPTGIGIFIHLNEIQRFMKTMQPKIKEQKQFKPRYRIGDL